MAVQAQTLQADPLPPRLHHSVMEFGRVILEMGSSAILAPVLKSLPTGDGHTIITVPGFMGADGSTARLRKFLRDRGYNAMPWGLGRNTSEGRPGSLDDFLAHRGRVEDRLARVIEAEFRASGAKVSLVGWSLGGLYSVALAHRYPEWIRQVITLGTPFGDPRYVTNMAVMASHVGFPFNPLVFAVIANHLVEPHERWALCRSSLIRPFVREVAD